MIRQPVASDIGNGAFGSAMLTFNQGRIIERSLSGQSRKPLARSNTGQLASEYLSQIWNTMTAAEQLAWTNYCTSGPTWPNRGRPRSMTAQESFVAISRNRALLGSLNVSTIAPDASLLLAGITARLEPFAVVGGMAWVLELSSDIPSGCSLLITGQAYRNDQSYSRQYPEVIITNDAGPIAAGSFNLPAAQIETAIGPFRTGLKLYLRARVVENDGMRQIGEACNPLEPLPPPPPPSLSYIFWTTFANPSMMGMVVQPRSGPTPGPQTSILPLSTISLEGHTVFAQPNFIPGATVWSNALAFDPLGMTFTTEKVSGPFNYDVGWGLRSYSFDGVNYNLVQDFPFPPGINVTSTTHNWTP